MRLVEPNPAYTELLKSVRKGDTVLNIGIGVTNETEADYYVFDKNSQLNTFSKERVDAYIEKYGPGILKEVVKMPLVNINQVLEEHFTGHVDDEITDFMETKEYTMRAKTFTNSIYVDKHLLSS